MTWIHREAAIQFALSEVMSKFKVTNVVSFLSAQVEEDEKIRLAPDGGNELIVEPSLEHEAADIFYVTFGFDSVEGDGDFRVTVRVTESDSKVVDFEAGDLHGSL